MSIIEHIKEGQIIRSAILKYRIDKLNEKLDYLLNEKSNNDMYMSKEDEEEVTKIYKKLFLEFNEYTMSYNWKNEKECEKAIKEINKEY